MVSNNVRFAILYPGTIFMSSLGNDDKLHIVENDRTFKDDPFYIDIVDESPDRYYWIGGDKDGRNVTHSVFKTDVSF